MEEVKIAAVSPLSFDGEEDYKNAYWLAKYLDGAISLDIIVIGHYHHPQSEDK